MICPINDLLYAYLYMTNDIEVRRQEEVSIQGAGRGKREKNGGKQERRWERQLTSIQRQQMSLGLHATFHINLGSIHALQLLLQVLVMAKPISVKEGHDLSAVKLGVAEHGLLRGEGAEHAVGAEEGDSIGVVSQAGDEAVDGRFSLGRYLAGFMGD